MIAKTLTEKFMAVNGITSGYGKNVVLHGVSLHVKEGQIVVLIGPNGAGKSTVLKTIMGYLKLRKGEVIFKGNDISNMKPNQLIPLGISYGIQGRPIFAEMTVKENLDMGAWTVENPSDKLHQVYELFPRLIKRRKQKAKTLSGGEQQMLSIARTLVTNPDLVLLDEPSLGLSPKFVNLVFDKILEINEQGTTFLIVEQNAVKALENSHRGYVLEMGKNRFEGNSKDLLKNQEVRQLYLGG